MDDNRRRVLDLESTLRTLERSPAGRLPVSQLRPLFNDAEWDNYKAMLEENRFQRSNDSLPPLSGDAQYYWDRFRDIYRRSTLIMNKQQAERLADEALELRADFDEMSAEDQNEFREVNAAEGDTKWLDRIEVLEEEFPIRKSALDHRPWLANLDGFTQKQFIENVIYHLSPQQVDEEIHRPQAKLLRSCIAALRR
ncbi:hypothetical protein [Methylobacterium sp. Leaf125]|uniref:hypothetical protein n=1 Tax=Methylobacterium sp. Leaf125 TaxID=1736265 RepID=UPI000ADF68AE|nr:hypothetical protein [Methylobacterium sp. Leaf125]